MIKLCGTASSIFAAAASLLRPPPGLRPWGETLIALSLMGILAFGLSYASPAITFSHPPMHGADTRSLLILIPVAFLIPALMEELVFRAGLPIMFGGGNRADILSLAGFILWHPVQTLFHLPMGQPAFLDPAFLTLVAVLGVSCTVLYRRSGSLLPAVILHWLVVVIWKSLGG
ncbi:MAG: CPBP family intramembrane metalloprotease [Alphaproteobacteria bacterium]|nr:CPBP family intramembrane metalloprotease [Alphaproteobacteria bacterium]